MNKRLGILVALILAIAGCAKDYMPAGARAYCEQWPERQECRR